jgi:hypothetical protein
MHDNQSWLTNEWLEILAFDKIQLNPGRPRNRGDLFKLAFIYAIYNPLQNHFLMKCSSRYTWAVSYMKN